MVAPAKISNQTYRVAHAEFSKLFPEQLSLSAWGLSNPLEAAMDMPSG